MLKNARLQDQGWETCAIIDWSGELYSMKNTSVYMRGSLPGTFFSFSLKRPEVQAAVLKTTARAWNVPSSRYRS